MQSRRADRGPRRWGVLLSLLALAPAGPMQDPAATGADVRAKAEAKVRAATEVLAMCRDFLVAPPGEKGTPPPLEVAETIQFWSRQLTDARLDLASDRAERIRILIEALDRARGFEAEVRDLTGNEASGLTKLSLAKARFAAADAELRLVREQAAPNR